MEQLNKDTVSKFSQLQSFKDALDRKKKVDTFYKSTSLAASSNRPRQSVSQGTAGCSLPSTRPPGRPSLNSVGLASTLHGHQFAQLDKKVGAALGGRKMSNSFTHTPALQQTQPASVYQTATKSSEAMSSTVQTGGNWQPGLETCNQMIRNPERIFNQEPATFSRIETQAQTGENWFRKNHTSVPSQRANKAVDEATECRSQIESFDSKQAQGKRTFKYPGRELGRITDLKTA